MDVDISRPQPAPVSRPEQNKKGGEAGNDCQRKEDTAMKEKIISSIRKGCALEEAVSPESELKALSLDSLSFVAVLVAIEEEFQIEFELDELDMGAWNTVADVIKAAEEKADDKK